MSESKEINVIDIKIVPYRYLKPQTTEKVLNKIYELDGPQRFLIHGPSLPNKVFYGPGKGNDVNHTYRKEITVNRNTFELRVMVGEIIITLDISKFNDFMENIEEILDEIMPCNYYMLVGIFSRTKTTISDYLKYGENFEGVIDNRYIGLVDSHRKSSETVNVIK